MPAVTPYGSRTLNIVTIAFGHSRARRRTSHVDLTRRMQRCRALRHGKDAGVVVHTASGVCASRKRLYPATTASTRTRQLQIAEKLDRLAHGHCIESGALLPVLDVELSPSSQNSAAGVARHGLPDGQRFFSGDDGLFYMFGRRGVDFDGVL